MMKAWRRYACVLGVCIFWSIGCRSTTSLRLDAEVKNIYDDEPRFYHLLNIVNAGQTDVTVLTAENLFSVGGNGDEARPLELTYGLGLERAVDEHGFVNVYSLYSFDPVTIHPGEYTGINTGEKNMVEWLNSKTGIVYMIFHYEITEDWGKRLNVWHGKISSPVLKVDLGPTTNRVSSRASQTIGSEASPQSGR